ncbi:MAG: TrkH family potassium uptake protein [Eggerthellaceae bacterium]|jgi:trk system potassium uptake protein TrkH|nr:TrkH family potassium uptake protein [Eggerthellaceae bacterium]
MWQRFTFYDVRVIGHYLGVLLLFFSFTLLVPLLTGLACREWVPASHYLLTIGIALIAGCLLRLLVVNPRRLNRQQALAVTGLSWIVLAFVASIPLFLSGHYANYLDALFDGVSGLTTTGATVIQDLDHLSYADNMWRFIMHFFGGLGLIVVALSFGLFGKQRGGANLYSSEGRSEHVVPNIAQTTRLISKIALFVISIATLVLAVCCLVLGMEPLRALLQGFWLAISGFMTGGFSPMSDSILYYHSYTIELVLMVLMILGSISFALHAEIWKGRTNFFFRDIEIRTALLWISVIAVVFAASFVVSMNFSGLVAMLRRGLFMIVAAFSTTGFQNVSANQLATAFSSGAFLSLALLMAVGGSAGSTTGGIKLRRIGIIGKSIIATIKETLAPDSARIVVDYHHVGRRLISPQITKEAMTVFALFVVTYVVGTMVGIAHGYEAVPAIFESIAMASNGGLSLGIIKAEMPPTLEIVYILEMWAGRLEFVTLLALFVEVIVSFRPKRRTNTEKSR